MISRVIRKSLVEHFAESRDGLDSRGADRHRVSSNHPKFHQNSPRAVDEWGN
jgi:hypothetical protein